MINININIDVSFHINHEILPKFRFWTFRSVVEHVRSVLCLSQDENFEFEPNAIDLTSTSYRPRPQERNIFVNAPEEEKRIVVKKWMIRTSGGSAVEFIWYNEGHASVHHLYSFLQILNLNNGVIM
jgi:hypothetical protein